MRKTGRCHLCGSDGDLSFEHVPPRSAYNDRQIFYNTIHDYAHDHPGDRKKRSSQRGFGDYTLCESCNSNTGSWYGADFVEWCRQGAICLEKTQGRLTSGYIYDIYPLRVLKQIVTMLFSVNSEEFQRFHQDLVRFVLNRDIKNLPAGYHTYVHFTYPGKGRLSGGAALSIAGTGPIYIHGEVAWFPFGYLITSEPLPFAFLYKHKHADITFFADYGYQDQRTLALRPPILETNTPFPIDYRTDTEVTIDYVKNKLWEAAQKKE